MLPCPVKGGVLSREDAMIRPAVLTDVSSLFALVRALAHYERLEHEFIGSEAALAAHLFPTTDGRRYAEALVAEDGGSLVGFAVFFHNYSTFVTRPGLYLEDLFVVPEHRRKGHGRALFRELARIAVDRGCGRLEWAVLDWNEPAIRFYRSIGAAPMSDWRICRLSGPGILALAK